MSEVFLKNPPKNPSAGEDVVHRFKDLADWLAVAAADAGLRIASYNGTEPLWFQKLPAANQKLILQHFSRYVGICRGTIADGSTLRDDRAFLWRFISHMNWRPTSDLFSLFDRDDVIEVYDLGSFVQVFRNLQFFDLCSYTLDELLCRPFWELFARDQAITERIMAMVEKLSSQEVRTSIKQSPEIYLNQEIDSPRLYRCKVEDRYISPLFDANGNTVAVVTIMRCHDKVSGLRRNGSRTSQDPPESTA